jgi:excisionase family DNA binding protein
MSEYLTDEDVALRVHRSVKTVRALLTSGTIRSAKVGRKRLVRSDWLDAYIESIAEGGERRLRPVRRRAS